MRYYHGTSDIIQFEDDTIKSALDTGILRESWRTKLLLFQLPDMQGKLLTPLEEIQLFMSLNL